MNERPELRPGSPPESPPETAAPPRRGIAPLLYAAAFLILSGATGYVWWAAHLPAGLAPVSDLPAGLAPTPDLTAVEQQLQRLDARLTQLEQRPRPMAADIGPVQSRIAALEQKPAADTGVAARLDALTGRLDGLSGRSQSADTELARKLENAEARLASMEHAAQQIQVQATKAERQMRLHAATQALNAGRKLGSLPNAPPALARFATVDPPTESGLRQAFAAAGRAALAASQPKLDGKPFLDRALARVEALITVRQGDHVLIGDPASGILDRVRTALETGDLTGAVNAAAALTGPAAEAMAPWLTDARALLEARAALLTLADNG